MRNTFIFVVVILLITLITIGAGTSAYHFLTNKGTEVVKETEEELIGGQEDEHGCLPTAGYTWCEAKEKCLREWEEPCIESTSSVEGARGEDEGELIKQALVEKHDWNPDNVTVTISKSNGEYATGTIDLADSVSGGTFLAVRDGQSWVIAHDGEDTVECSILDAYPEYPVDMIPKCKVKP